MQFSLSRLFAVVTISAFVIAILMYLTTSYRERLRVEAQLHALGAYHVAFSSDNSVATVSFHEPVKTPDIARFQTIKVLDFKEAHVTPESLEFISGLPNVRLVTFCLSDVRDEDIPKLQNLASLRILWLSYTNVSDACLDAIAELPALERVDLLDTQITLQGIERLKAKRPSLVITTNAK